MSMNWRDIAYLASGTLRQRSAYDNLTDLRILEALADFDAVLASTVNTDIDIGSSDLDVICEARDLAAFEAQLVSLYGMKAGFEIRASDVSPPALVARFYHCDWEYEVFGQDVRIERKNAYRHLVQTHRVLVVGGEEWRKAIRMLKQQGIKTEPAVAQCLRLSGDPYQAVLSLELLSDEQLVRLIEKGLAHSVMQVQ